MASKRAKLIQTRCGAASWRFSIPWVESRIQAFFRNPENSDSAGEKQLNDYCFIRLAQRGWI